MKTLSTNESDSVSIPSVGVKLSVNVLIIQTRLPDVQDIQQDAVVAVEVRSVDTQPTVCLRKMFVLFNESQRRVFVRLHG